MHYTLRLVIPLICLIVAGSGVALAYDDMPAPKRAPRTPVAAQKLEDGKKTTKLAVGDELTGVAEIIDTERLKIEDRELRLFGVVPPQLSASWGPQTRAALDARTKGDVTCRIRDRDHDGRLLASCGAAGTPDIALALIDRGLAVVARGTVEGSDLAASYIAAESRAQDRHVGLWSGTTAKTADKLLAPVVEKTEAKPEPVPTPVPVAPVADPATTTAVAGVNTPAAVDLLAVWLLLIYIVANTVWQALARAGTERRERRLAAAALRGELAAARAICQTKAESLSEDLRADPRGQHNPAGSNWPRLRTVVFQAHVGRIGLLGAELSRKVTSLYGQFADYAAYIGAQAVEGAGKKADPASVRTVLLTLMVYIEMTMEELERVERSGTWLAWPQRRPHARRPAAQPQPVPEAAMDAEEADAVLDEIVTVEDTEQSKERTGTEG